VHTDGWSGYSGLDAKGYIHQATILKGRKESASDLLPRVHRVISLLKRWLMGTHQGAVSHKHLDYYLDEFTFRFNRRKSNSRSTVWFSRRLPWNHHRTMRSWEESMENERPNHKL
jgi:transposase-like protein